MRSGRVTRDDEKRRNEKRNAGRVKTEPERNREGERIWRSRGEGMILQEIWLEWAGEISFGSSSGKVRLSSLQTSPSPRDFNFPSFLHI